MDLILIEASQVSEAGPGEGEQQRLAHLRKPRRGQVCFDHSCALIAGSQVSARGKSQTDVPYVLIEFDSVSELFPRKESRSATDLSKFRSWISIADYLGMIFEPEEEALFELATERLPDMGNRTRLEALNPS